MKHYFAAIIASLLLTGCVSPEQQAQQVQELRAQIESKCEEYGIKPGTPQMLDCKLKIKQMLIQQNQANQADYQNNMQIIKQNLCGPNAVGYPCN